MFLTEDLIGQQVLLTQLNVEDVTPGYVDWLNDPEVNMFLESRFDRHSLESVKLFVEKQLDDNSVCFWKIIDRSSGQHIGNIKLGPIDARHGVADIGLMIGDSAFRGRRIGRESVEMVTEFAFNTMQLSKVTAHAYELNTASIRLFQSLGFKVEGNLRSHRICDGKRIAFIAMGKLKGE